MKIAAERQTFGEIAARVFQVVIGLCLLGAAGCIPVAPATTITSSGKPNLGGAQPATDELSDERRVWPIASFQRNRSGCRSLLKLAIANSRAHRSLWSRRQTQCS